ncbi:unnamed protein product [Nezara viridula]|uniref:Uncharacterized protein n=1 Tax=Nezara viridula TaxID=85310 RepID=A0A9P0MME3_NEZVI|nr:unnamed protein product [Nezara viridula]
MTLSEEARTGSWNLEVLVGTSVFSEELNVSLSRGSKDPALPALPIAEEHYVELGFSKEMRRRYKPGLPFVGKLGYISSNPLDVIRLALLSHKPYCGAVTTAKVISQACYSYKVSWQSQAALTSSVNITLVCSLTFA